MAQGSLDSVMTAASAPREFRDVLRDELSQRGMTHKAFAGLIGVSENSVSSWTKGTYRPRHARMEAIAAQLNLTIDQLHGRPSSTTAPAAPAAPAGATSTSLPPIAPPPAPAPPDDEAQRIVEALAALDLEGTVEALQRMTPPLMDILAAARRHIG
jgi:transcriptional regulator with XRE-family HTH domain